jgi:hypothetical protein
MATTTMVSILILIAFGDFIAVSLSDSRRQQNYRKEER